MSVEEFEETYGNLQTQYNEWRRKTDEYNKEERSHDSGHSVPYFTECVFGEAREDFSQYCDLPETIPVDVMFNYENNYSDTKTTMVVKTWYCVASSYDNNGRVRASIVDMVQAIEEPKSIFSSGAREDTYIDWFDSKEAAEKFVETAKKA